MTPPRNPTFLQNAIPALVLAACFVLPWVAFFAMTIYRSNP